METSLAEDVKKPTRTLSPDSFFFMSPYRSFTTSGCFRRFSQPAVGGDALNGEFSSRWRPPLPRPGRRGSASR